MPPSLVRKADLAECRSLLRGGSRSFQAASLLLPSDIRDPATILYAFCRLADDAVDLGGVGSDAVGELHYRLDLIYLGQPAQIAADRALCDIITGFGLPRALFDALIEGFAWDATGRRYEDLAGLRAYAARVAGSVGALMAMIMGVRAPETIQRAAEMGVAMQLSNIARDVGEDARAGRLYLPLGWLRQADIDADRFLANPVFTPALGSVVARLLAAAETLYAGALGAIADLPRACRPGIHAAGQLYAEIGREVARRGYDSVSSRAVVSMPRKLRVVARGLIAGEHPALLSAEPVGEVEFLVHAVVNAPLPCPPAEPARAARWWRLGDQAVAVIDLFERLERRERA